MELSTIDQGIATQIGHYADAVVVPSGYDQILVSGTPGIDQDGELADDITGQTEQAWENVTRILDAAGAGINDIVYIRQWLTSESDVAGYFDVRTRYISHRPGGVLVIVPSLAQPRFRVELEVIAARPPQEESL